MYLRKVDNVVEKIFKYRTICKYHVKEWANTGEENDMES
jgi:hypothetical protein